MDEALFEVGMYDYRFREPYKLSGGQKRRVAIAGVLAMATDCIVLDEPTAMLDPKGREEVMSHNHSPQQGEGYHRFTDHPFHGGSGQGGPGARYERR